jgi:DNA-binding XRE family transcriptional regulator
MSPPEHTHDQGCLHGLPDVANVLGVTRSAVNLMVRDGRLEATRYGPRWYVCDEVLESFRSTYTPAPSAGRKLGRRSGDPDMTESVLELLADWGEARVDEISEVVQRDPGNVRKYLAILRERGLVAKTTNATWIPTAVK